MSYPPRFPDCIDAGPCRYSPLTVNVSLKGSKGVWMNIFVTTFVIHVVVTLYGRPFLHFQYPPGNQSIE
ncbi:hypothetical protein Hanom_Chr04g00370511 [Helianthus anomalus]